MVSVVDYYYLSDKLCFDAGEVFSEFNRVSIVSVGHHRSHPDQLKSGLVVPFSFALATKDHSIYMHAYA